MILKDAVEYLLGSIESTSAVEEISIVKSCGRILAENLKASQNIPPFDNSQVDGYAVKTSDINLSNLFSVSQRIPAGCPSSPLVNKTIARIFTGALIPKNADAVVMQEDVDLVNDRVRFSKKINPGQNIRKKGSDLKQDKVFFNTGRVLTAADVGMCASVGLNNLQVFEKISVGVFSSGDELKQPGENLSEGQIYDSNRPMILSLVNLLGLEPVDMGCLPDDLNQTTRLLAEASNKVDIILTCGGVSVGEEDHIKTAVETLGSIKMWKIKIKPGKPFAFGSIGNTPFLGVPGNPVSAWVTFALLCRPFLIKRAGGISLENTSLLLECNFEWPKSSNRQEFLRGKVNREGKLEIFNNQNSQILSSICFSEGLIEIPIDTVVRKGDKIKFFPFSEIS